MDWLSAEEGNAVLLSLQVAVLATLLTLPLGIALGWVLARKDFPGKTLLETVVHLPLVLPPVVTGYFLLVLCGRRGWLGPWLESLGLQLVFTWQGAVVAAAVMAFPLMVRAIRQAFAGVDPRLEEAARTLGAGPLRTFFRISLPLARRGVVAGAVLAFARSLGEFGATIMLAGNIPGVTQTMPLYVYSMSNAPGGLDNSLRLVLVAVAIAFLALFLSEWLERQGTRRPSAEAALP